MRTCGKCSEYDKENGICKVTFVIKGEDMVLSVCANDECVIEREGLLQDIHSIRMWSDGHNGYVERTEPKTKAH